MRRSMLLTAIAWVVAFATSNWGTHSRADEPAAPSEPAVAATVNGSPIYVAEVENVIEQLRKQRSLDPRGAAFTQADVLQQLVERRLVEQAITQDESLVKKAEVDKALANAAKQLSAQKMTLEQFAAKSGVTVDSLRSQVLWELAWNRYLEQNLANGVEQYFKDHRKDLDGTQVRASHILLRSEKPGESTDALIEKAKQIRADILAKKTTFEQAAERYSSGPSRQEAGDVGAFPRYGVMADAFAKAAFELEKGDVSEPVVSGFGVHLIKVTDVKPGNKQWTEVIPQIKGPATQDLFTKIADRQRATAKIEFTGKLPHFKPGTRELASTGESRR